MQPLRDAALQTQALPQRGFPSHCSWEHAKESLQARCVLMEVCAVVIKGMEEDAPSQSSILRGLCQNMALSFADCVCYGFERQKFIS